MQLTEQHKAALAGAGIDWQAVLTRVKNALPLLIAIAQIFLSDNPPVMQACGPDCCQKEKLQAILHSQLCAAHGLCEAICACDDK